LSGGGEMGALMRSFDWSQTALGPVSAWPQSLKTAVRIVLTSRYAMFVWWGRELVNLYNDPYRGFLGAKHPGALGKSAREVWAEIWDQIGPRTDAVLLRGESTYDEALLLLMERHGYLEETYFTFSYSPLPDDHGDVGGLFCAVTEDTQRVIGQRRLALLREIAAAMAEARTPVQVCQKAAQSLASARRDLPFSLIYLVEGDSRTLTRVTEAGIAADHPAAPDRVSLDGDAGSVWPFRRVIESGEATLVEKLGERIADIPTGEWSHAPERAILVPIAQHGQARPAGVLVAGLNPHRQFDDEFRGFVSLLANQIAAGIASAVASDREARLRAEAELERQQLKELLTQAPAAIAFMSGPEHRWTFVNDCYVRVTGRKSAQDFLGKTVREGLPELVGQGFLEPLDQVYRTGESFVGREMKARLNRSASGLPEEAHFNFVYQPICDTGENVEGILVHAVEVTDQVTARRIIEESEERLRLAQTAAQIGTWEWDPVHDTRTLSAELHRIFGTNPNDPQYRQVWESRVHPADWQRVQDHTEAGYRDGSMEFEYRYHHPEHGLRWFYCKGRRLRDDSRMVGVLLDITDRKQVEEARHRLAAIVESSDDAIISKDLGGIVTSWNAGAEKTFGYTAAEMVGRPITVIIPPELHDDERRILDAIGRGERIDHFETVRMTKSGERLDVSLTISPVKDDAGRIIGAAKIARDITQRKKAEQALRTTERLASVGRLAATMAHEINNPLEAVINLVYLAKNKAGRKDVREYLSIAEEELERVSQLTKQTLGFYRDTRGAISTNIGSQLLSLLSVFSSRTRNKAIEIRPEIRQNPEIVAVPGEIRQLVANLLSNSIDAISARGLIRIRVSAATERKAEGRSGVRLTVADSGPGIPLAVRSKLFEPFFTSNKEVGTGLGLWVCKTIVEKHGGDIRVKSSVTPGRSWTVFSIFLPLKPELSALELELQQTA
jgi:PAS domain S-box-containing protein